MPRDPTVHYVGVQLWAHFSLCSQEARVRAQKNINWLLTKITPSEAAPKDRESENTRETTFQELILQPHLFYCSHILLLKPQHGSCSHSLAHVVINWLLQLHLGSCSHFFAPTAPSLLLQPHLNSWSHLLAPIATTWLLELDFISLI